MSVLAEIVSATRADVAHLRTRTKLADLQALAEMRLEQRPPLDVITALRAPDVSVIAEVKRRSPSAGQLSEISQPAVLASQYEAGGASMVSVLTEPQWFHGSMQDLEDVRGVVRVPVLRKDFIIDELQILQACAAGADAVLLIVAALPGDELRHLLTCVEQWGMTALVEVHDEQQTERATQAGALVIGVNARNLDTLKVDTATFERVVHSLPDSCVKVAESGLRTPEDVAHVVRAGADAVLIGQALVQSSNPAELISQMKEAARGAR